MARVCISGCLDVDGGALTVKHPYTSYGQLRDLAGDAFCGAAVDGGGVICAPDGLRGLPDHTAFDVAGFSPALGAPVPTSGNIDAQIISAVLTNTSKRRVIWSCTVGWFASAIRQGAGGPNDWQIQGYFGLVPGTIPPPAPATLVTAEGTSNDGTSGHFVGWPSTTFEVSHGVLECGQSIAASFFTRYAPQVFNANVGNAINVPDQRIQISGWTV